MKDGVYENIRNFDVNLILMRPLDFQLVVIWLRVFYGLWIRVILIILFMYIYKETNFMVF